MKTRIIAIIVCLSPVFLCAEDGNTIAERKARVMKQEGEVELEKAATEKEMTAREAKVRKETAEIEEESQAEMAEEVKRRKEMAGKMEGEEKTSMQMKKVGKEKDMPAGLAKKEGEMPPGLAKQSEKKAEQVQKDADKAAPEAQEKRKKWWKFW